jgi:peptidoglycan/xylan/chitin deacetylase (PgdA/CDA1 family)
MRDMTGMSSSSAIAILTYHSLDDSGSVLSTSPKAFAEQMEILSDSDVKVISLDHAPDLIENSHPAAERLVAITFDDGFQNVLTTGLPILQRRGFPATVFLVTAYCGGDNSWPSQPQHVARRPLLDWSQIKEMSAAGISFGSHTCTHPDLTCLPPQFAEQEMITSKKTIEDSLGRSVQLLAYPYGAYNQTVKQFAQLHFSLAFTTELDFVRTASDLAALERLDCYYLRHSILFRRLFSPKIAAYIRFRRKLHALRR